MKKLSIFGKFFVALVLISGCGKDILNNESTSLSIRNEREPYSMDVYVRNRDSIFLAKEELAKTISMVGKINPSLFVVFEKLCLEAKTNGYYEVEFFFNLEKDKIRFELGNKSIYYVLCTYNPSIKKWIDFLCEKHPALTIVLVGDEGSNYYNSKVYVNNELDDSNPNELIPYYENGIRGSVSQNQTPALKSFVLKECEIFIPENEVNKYKPDEVKLVGISCDYPIYVFNIFDWDKDGIFNWLDNCPTTFNPDQLDSDHDGYGDVCDPSNIDSDNDGIRDEIDNCPFNYNPDQLDSDQDGLGDVCDIGETCERDLINGKENFHKFKATKDWESFGYGNESEFILQTIIANDAKFEFDQYGNLRVVGNPLSSVKKTFEGDFDDGKWHDVDLDIFRWDKLGDGKRIRHIIKEHDWGFKTKVTMGFDEEVKIVEPSTKTEVSIKSTSKIELEWSKGDDDVGDSMVDYCDFIDLNGFEYHPSTDFYFTCNERYY